MVEYIDGEIVEFDIFDAPGAAEDIVFEAQHRMERLSFEHIRGVRLMNNVTLEQFRVNSF